MRPKKQIRMEDTISLKGNKVIWTQFVNKLRTEKKYVWEVLITYINKELEKPSKVRGKAKK